MSRAIYQTKSTCSKGKTRGKMGGSNLTLARTCHLAILEQTWGGGRVVPPLPTLNCNRDLQQRRTESL